MHVVANALGFLNDNGLWQGGSYIVETTVAWLDDVDQHEELLSKDVHEGTPVIGIGASFNPQYFQVFPGTDLTIPLSVSYTISGDASPMALSGNEGVGNASVGAEFLVNQAWTISAKYNIFFGSSDNGIGGLLKDRDNVALTIKRTF
jgi:hypothetical protein